MTFSEERKARADELVKGAIKHYKDGTFDRVLLVKLFEAEAGGTAIERMTDAENAAMLKFIDYVDQKFTERERVLFEHGFSYGFQIAHDLVATHGKVLTDD